MYFFSGVVADFLVPVLLLLVVVGKVPFEAAGAAVVAVAGIYCVSFFLKRARYLV